MQNKNVFVVMLLFFPDKVISFYGKNICHTYMYNDPFIIFFSFSCLKDFSIPS